MGLGCSAPGKSQDWQCDPGLRGVQALGRLFFAGASSSGSSARAWDCEAATLIALAHKSAPPSRYGQALVDREWWGQHIAAARPDDEAVGILFDLMATDPA